jgi:hypothetical protein
MGRRWPSAADAPLARDGRPAGRAPRDEGLRLDRDRHDRRATAEGEAVDGLGGGGPRGAGSRSRSSPAAAATGKPRRGRSPRARLPEPDPGKPCWSSRTRRWSACRCAGRSRAPASRCGGRRRPSTRRWRRSTARCRMRPCSTSISAARSASRWRRPCCARRPLRVLHGLRGAGRSAGPPARGAGSRQALQPGDDRRNGAQARAAGAGCRGDGLSSLSRHARFGASET